jgi:hypothetical protein
VQRLRTERWGGAQNRSGMLEVTHKHFGPRSCRRNPVSGCVSIRTCFFDEDEYGERIRFREKTLRGVQWVDWEAALSRIIAI